MAVIEAIDVRKRYGSHDALRGLDLRVDDGEIVAVLGPNGAGKTTLVEILEGFRPRDSGSATVLGFDPATGGREMRERIGIVLQESAVDPYLSVREVLRMYAGHYRDPRPVDEVIELVGLAEKVGARVKTLSGGQLRRLDVALGLVGDPELLFLDEPTTGFDPSARRQAWTMIERLRSLGKTVLLTTHYMDEAQQLADRVVVVVEGRVVADGPPGSIGNRATAKVRIRFRLPAGTAADDLPMVPARVDSEHGRDRGRSAHGGAPPADRLGTRAERRPSRTHRGSTVTRGRLSGPHRGNRREHEARGPPMSLVRDAVRQTGWEQRMYWRNPGAAGFTFAFPLMFLVVFTAINGNDTVDVAGGTVRFAQFYVPAIVAFGLISGCYTNLAFVISNRRESGVLKRTRGTPASPVAYIGGLVGNVIVVSAILSTLVIALGLLVYDITFPARYLGLAVTIVAGAFAFSGLGVAVSTFIPNEDAAPAIVNFILFPLLFISGTFGPVEEGSTLARIAQVFPVWHLNRLMEDVFNPFGHGTGLSAAHILVLSAWGTAACAVALRRFRWEPRNR